MYPPRTYEIKPKHPKSRSRQPASRTGKSCQKHHRAKAVQNLFQKRKIGDY